MKLTYCKSVVKIAKGKVVYFTPINIYFNTCMYILPLLFTLLCLRKGTLYFTFGFNYLKIKYLKAKMYVNSVYLLPLYFTFSLPFKTQNT